LKVQSNSLLPRLLFSTFGKIVLVTGLILFLIGATVFFYFYVQYGKIVDERLKRGPFASTSLIYGAPEPLGLGDPATSASVAAVLRRKGYTESNNNRTGWYRLRQDAIEVYPGVDSYFDSEGGVIQFAGEKVSRIVSLRDNTSRKLFLLEPEVITNLFDKKREKRKLIKYADLPQVMVDALISAEDKRFFDHPGVDPLRLTKAIYEDLRAGSKRQGASTISMQLARSFFLSTERTWSRKLPELMITLHLEQKLTKEEIFEFYCNEIYLGQRGSFSIHGFAQGSQAFFGKELEKITLPEAALMAGMIQGPSLYAPWRFPERAKKRRNIILMLMRDNKVITQRQYQEATEAPIVVSPTDSHGSEAPYFVDMINERLHQDFESHDFQSHGYRIYTTLDLKLQRIAQEAIDLGMAEVDKNLAGYYKKGWPKPQVSLVALDAETGDVRALVGGRDYGASQLNRALAKRQPGSVFKPFVYAAAMESGLREGAGSLTPASVLMDEPTVFEFNGRNYEPGNFHGKFVGAVTVRDALAMSLNIPTVKLAEKAGYGQVVNVARRAGLNSGIKPTPSVALGSYETTPLEMASAYTVFPNNGYLLSTQFIRAIRDEDRQMVFEAKSVRKAALDPRVNFLVLSMMKDVVNRGTGAGIRARGFTLPAAGKTGTSHDGWFAGFTSKLVVAVWVGFDDNRELPLEGARSALPVWIHFMKKAHQVRGYSKVRDFGPPPGIVTASIDVRSGLLSREGCGPARTEFFIEGSQPVDGCGGGTTVGDWTTAQEAPKEVEGGAPANPEAVAEEQKKPPKKRGVLSKLKDLFK
jgi:penicillin-binding protein 1B